MRGRHTRRREGTRNVALHITVRRTVGVCVCLCILAALIGIQLLVNAYNEQFVLQQGQLAEQYYAQIQSYMNETVRMSMMLISDEMAQSALATICNTPGDTYTNAQARMALQSATARIAGERSQFIRHISVVDMKGHFYSYGGVVANEELNNQIRELIDQSLQDGSPAWHQLTFDDVSYLVLIRAIRRTENLSLQLIGFQAILLDLDACLNQADIQNRRFANSTQIFLDGELVHRGTQCPSGSEGITGGERWKIVRLARTRYLVTQTNFYGDRISIVTYMDYTAAMGALLSVRLLLLSAMLLFMLATLLAAIKRIDRRFRGLEELTAAVEKVQYGDFHVELRPELLHADDEVGVFARHFQHSMNCIDELVNKELKKQLYAAQAQCRMLQAQIRPHFLYNTLETIYAIAIRDGNTQISRMALSLSRLVRASYAGSMWTTLGTEIAFVQEYLSIYRVRFGSRLNALIEYDPDDDGVMMPQMTLQPLVENSIRYGLMKKVTKGVIRLRIRHCGDRLKISLYDNGTGFPKELIEKYKTDLLADQLEMHGHANVLARLRYTYGDNAEVNVRSKEGAWTNMSITIPDKLPEHIQKEAEKDEQDFAGGR